jgi:hypothetical protein
VEQEKKGTGKQRSFFEHSGYRLQIQSL